MGNFQYLAEQVLIKSKANVGKVSSFHPLAKETGNFQPSRGNPARNLNEIDVDANQFWLGLCMETSDETNRKPLPITQETLRLDNTIKSFLRGSDLLTIFNGFFDGVDQIGIQLLPEDKRWIKAICFGVQSSRLKVLLEKYITCWIGAMNRESIQYKKQNAGRYAANIFIREEIKNGR